MWLRQALKRRLGHGLKLDKDERGKLVALILDACSEQKSDDFSVTVKRWLETATITRTDKPPYKGGRAQFLQSGWVAKEKHWTDHCLAELLTALGFRARTSGMHI